MLFHENLWMKNKVLNLEIRILTFFTGGISTRPDW